jgi:CRP-like cAMP-binding protein
MTTASVVKQPKTDRQEQSCSCFPETVALGTTVTARAGQTIVLEGDPIDYYYRIVTGSVRLYNAVADGRRQIIDFLGPKACFGLTGLSHHAYSVEAITEVTMIRYQRQRLNAAFEETPSLGRQLFQLACTELGQAQRRMLLLGRKSAEEKVASFLLDLAERQEEDQGDDWPDGRRCLHLAMSRQDIADHLGLTIETVSRIFTRLKRSGLIDLPSRQSVGLRRVDQLQQIADGQLAV